MTITPLSPASLLRRHASPAALALLLGCAFCGCNSTPDDSTLTNNVQSAIRGDAAINQQPVQVAVHSGVVTLTGHVTDETASSVAAQDAARVKGVKQVINSLAVGSTQMSSAGSLPTLSAQPAPVLPSANQRVTQPAPVSSARTVAPAPPPVPVQSTPTTAPVASVSPAAVVRDVTVPAGTVIPVRITETLNSETAEDGQAFNGTVTGNVVRNGLVVIPSGSAVSGRVVAVKDAGHFKGHSELAIELTSVRRRGSVLPIATSTYSVEGKNRGKNSAIKIGGGAAAGAILGGIFGGGKGAAIGSLAGGGAGTAVQGLTRGQQVSIPSESLIRFRLQRPLTVSTSELPSTEEHPGLRQR